MQVQGASRGQVEDRARNHKSKIEGKEEIRFVRGYKVFDGRIIHCLGKMDRDSRRPGPIRQRRPPYLLVGIVAVGEYGRDIEARFGEIGRASCRERV